MPEDIPKLGLALAVPNAVIKCDFFSVVYFFLVDVSVGLNIDKSGPFLTLNHLNFREIGFTVHI